MVDKNQSGSFIPKQGNDTRRAKRQTSLNLFMLVALLLLGLSITVFAGAYGYRYVLDRGINKPCSDGGACGLKATVENVRQELGIERIIRYNRLDKKMKVAEDLINDHTSIEPLLSLLEETTLHSVRYTSLDFSADQAVILKGLTASYTDLAAQMKALQTKPEIRSVVFSNLDLDANNQVIFTAKILPASSLLLFKANNQ